MFSGRGFKSITRGFVFNILPDFSKNFPIKMKVLLVQEWGFKRTTRTTFKSTTVGQGHPMVMFYINVVELETVLLLHAMFQHHRTLETEEKGFYHTWAWRPS